MTITKTRIKKAEVPAYQNTELSFPKRKLNIQTIVVRTFSLAAVGILIGLLSFTFFKPDYISNLFSPARRHKASLLNLPGQQFLPSLERPLNILVMGVDSNGKNTERFSGTRSDTMMLVSVDPSKNKVGIISIPRDSRVQIARHSIEKINSAHALGGPQLALETVSENFNVPIDHYLVVDTQGLKRLLEILGPIDVLVEKKMSYVDHTAKLCVNLEPGLQTLDANQAEQYIRFRHDLRGDIGRIERQQWFARQMVNKLADPQIVTKIPGLMKVISECIMTDLSADDMIRLFGFACNVDPKQIKMATLPGTPGFINGISYWVLQPSACSSVLDKLVNHETRNSAKNSFSIGHDSAMAFVPVKSDNVNTSADGSSILSAIIRYPKGSEEQASNLETRLKQSGFTLRGKYAADIADCQHEEVVENTTQGLSFDPTIQRDKLPFLSNYPTVVNIDPQAGADLTFVITANSQF